MSKLSTIQDYMSGIVFLVYAIALFLIGILWTVIYSIFSSIMAAITNIRQPKIYSAVFSRDISQIEWYLNRGGDINALAIARKTGLHLAVELRNYELVKFLLNKKAEVNHKDKYSVTPLYIAVATKQERLVELLISYGAVSDIFITTLQGNFEALQNYLQVGGNPNALIGKYRQSLLELAIKAHSLEMVELLLKQGAVVNYRNSYNSTPLYIAASEGQFAISEVLIDLGAEVNAVCRKQTILDRAVQSGNKYLVELLLNKRAKINLKFKLLSCYTLHQAVEQGNLDIVELLINNGAKVDLRNDFPLRETSLHIAVKRGHTEIVKLLLLRGANIHLKTFFPSLNSLQMATDYPEIYHLIKSYETVVSFAVFNAASQGNFNFVRDYLESGGNVNAIHHRGITLLHCAASQGHNELVQLLIDSGANINAKTQQEITPLLLAARHSIISNNQSTAALLIVHGAIVDSQSAVLLKNIELFQTKLKEDNKSKTKNKNNI